MKRKHCFELFGYDFIIDEDFNTWMIEVNTNPCLEESSSILKMLLPRMVEDMLRLTVDSLFNHYKNIENDPDSELDEELSPTKSLKEEIKQQKKPYRFPSVDNYSDEENMWEMVVDLRDRKSRKEAKAKLLTPIQLNSSHAFQLKDRGFKIKKYAPPQNWTTFKESMAAHAERGAAMLSSDAAEKEMKAQYAVSSAEQDDIMDVEGEGDELVDEEVNAVEP